MQELSDKDKEALVTIKHFEDALPANAFDEGGKCELGWEWRDVRVHTATITNLFLKGLLDLEYSSNSYKGYRLSNIGRNFVVMLIDGKLAINSATETKMEAPMPDDLFDTIIGYDDLKILFKRALTSDKPIHILLTGVPASAKTMFLIELSRIGATYILGSQATKAGISQILFDIKPTILLVDEIDRIGPKDISILLSLAETGIISEAKYGKHREEKLDTRIFAASNTIRMPRELLSRFMILHFKPYSKRDFITVTENTLIKREHLNQQLAKYIAGEVWNRYGYGMPDPREAVRISRLAKTEDEVNEILSMLAKYSII